MGLPGKLAQGLGLALISSSLVSAAVPLNICADFNTAETDSKLDIYMTNGLCKTTCMDKYAYAITQYQSCWCSNYGPDDASEVDLGKCNTPCPAYPEYEKCGGKDLFGYVLLGNVKPSGTRGPSKSSSTTSEASSKTSEQAMTTTATASVTETVQITVTEATSSGRTSVTTSSSSSSLTSSTPPEESTSAPPESFSTSISTVTADGTIKTVTVVFSPSSSASKSDENQNTGESQESKGLGTGAVVGIVVGVIAAVLIIAGALVFWFLRRRKQPQDDGYQEDPSVRGGSPGTMGSPEMMGAGPGSASNTVGTRNSMLQIDPRMDPFRGQGLYARAGSHESLNTLRDDQDYTRRIQQPLRATNPDPDID